MSRKKNTGDKFNHRVYKGDKFNHPEYKGDKFNHPEYKGDDFSSQNRNLLSESPLQNIEVSDPSLLDSMAEDCTEP
jgi:hypothetical protein